ncbi:MAG: hypothetical protein SH808_08790 [Saprospiraceae bacterium]|nr:hypothetical protein [Saprospiraceae bacterium]
MQCKDFLSVILYTGLSLGYMTNALHAQSSLAGRVADETHQPVPFANVLLLSTADSSLVKGGVAGDDGCSDLALLVQEVILSK